MYTIYHIPGIKVGCSKDVQERIKKQGFDNYEILEIHEDKEIASKREIELQLEYFGERDCKTAYVDSLYRITKLARTEEALKKKAISIQELKQKPEYYENKRRAQTASIAKQKQDPEYIEKRRLLAFKNAEKGIGFQSKESRAKGGLNKRKPILQFKVDGTFVKEYDSQITARAMTGITTIADVLAGRQITGGGFIWKYKNKQ